MSTKADVPSQTMTGALNFWNCSHSGTLLMAAAVAKPPTVQDKRWRVELSLKIDFIIIKADARREMKEPRISAATAMLLPVRTFTLHVKKSCTVVPMIA